MLISNPKIEEFYETFGFIKLPFDDTGYGMVKRIHK